MWYPIRMSRSRKRFDEDSAITPMKGERERIANHPGHDPIVLLQYRSTRVHLMR